jgi:beta-galactosidase
MDGLLHSNHTPTPGLIEYKKAIEPVQVLEESTYDKVIIINRYDFLTLDHLRCEWSVVGDGFMRPREEIVIPAGIEPGKTAELVISGLSLAELSSESYIELRFTLKESTQWADAGHEVACSQVLIKPGKSIATLTEATSGSCPTIKKLSPSILEISGSEAYKWQFDLVRGELLSWQESPKALLHKTFSLDFYRALTDNDRPQDGEHWLSKRLDQATTTVRSTTVSIDQAMSSVKIIVKARIAPPVFEWSVDTTTTFTFRSRSVAIHVVGKPQGINLPRTFARIGLAFSLHSSITQAEWFGRGSGESYKDKKLSQHFGNWTMPIDELFTNYEYPQESGNRTDIRWVRFFDDKKSAGSASKGGLKASFGTQDGCSFSASHFEMADVDECRHPYELEKKRKDEVIVRLDWDHHGIGTGSCGPKTLPQYELLSKDFEFEVLLE